MKDYKLSGREAAAVMFGLADDIEKDLLSLYDLSNEVTDLKTSLAASEANLMATASKEGNDTARKAKLKELKESDGLYNARLTAVREAERRKVILEAQIERRRRYFTAHMVGAGLPTEAFTAAAAALTHRVSQ